MKQKNTDILIIGLGLAGMTTAITAAKSGKKQNMGKELLIMSYGENKLSIPVRGEQLDLFKHTFL